MRRRTIPGFHVSSEDSLENAPEPSFEELYDLHIEFMAAKRRSAILSVAGNSYLEEELAILLQPLTKEAFQQQLDEVTEMGSRHILVNQLVYGFDEYQKNSDDPHFKVKAADKIRMLDTAWESVIDQHRQGNDDSNDFFKR